MSARGDNWRKAAEHERAKARMWQRRNCFATADQFFLVAERYERRARAADAEAKNE